MRLVMLFVILILKSDRIIAADHCEKDSCKKPCRNIVGDLDENKPSIVYKTMRGQLGNQLNGYAMMLQLKRKSGYDAYLTRSSYEILTKMFTKESIELPILEDTFCNVSDMNFKVFDTNLTELVLENSPHASGKLYELFPPQEQKVFLPPKDEAYRKFEKGIKVHLRNTLKILPNYVKMAQSTMTEIAKVMKKPSKEVTYVAIHHRQTDFKEFAKTVFKEKGFKKSYFYDAMENFREEVEPDPIAFLYVSDDMNAGKKFLKNRKKDLFFVGKSMDKDAKLQETSLDLGYDNYDAVGHDFAGIGHFYLIYKIGTCFNLRKYLFLILVLVHSNATIVTHGSFSMWASILNGMYYYAIIMNCNLQDDYITLYHFQFRWRHLWKIWFCQPDSIQSRSLKFIQIQLKLNRVQKGS